MEDLILKYGAAQQLEIFFRPPLTGEITYNGKFFAKNTPRIFKNITSESHHLKTGNSPLANGNRLELIY